MQFGFAERPWAMRAAGSSTPSALDGVHLG